MALWEGHEPSLSHEYRVFTKCPIMTNFSIITLETIHERIRPHRSNPNSMVTTIKGCRTSCCVCLRVRIHEPIEDLTGSQNTKKKIGLCIRYEFYQPFNRLTTATLVFRRYPNMLTVSFLISISPTTCRLPSSATFPSQSRYNHHSSFYPTTVNQSSRNPDLQA
jgi:hypothetical protein